MSKSKKLPLTDAKRQDLPITQARIAERYNVSRVAVTHWIQAGCPMTSWEAVEEWRVARNKEEPKDIQAAKLRKTLLEVEKLELQNAEVRGDLISRAEVREAGVRIGSTLSAEMMELVNDLPGMLAGLDEAGVRERLQPRIDLVLSSFKAKLEAT
jgi:hypothetical protein